jgi:hypothetical protein
MPDLAPTDPDPYVLGPWDRRQRGWMLAGSLYDGSFGVLMLAIPKAACALFGLPYPVIGEIWLRLDGIFLLVMAALYVLTARDPGRYLGIVAVCLAGKVVSIAFYCTYVFGFGEAKIFLMFAALDFVFLCGHAWALGPNGGQRLIDAFRPARLPVVAAHVDGAPPG